jgi:nitrous oxide reductase accessory protein NosL
MRVQTLVSTAVVAAGLLADSACAKGSHVPLPASVQKRYESHFQAMSAKREVEHSDPKHFRFLSKKTERELFP